MASSKCLVNSNSVITLFLSCTDFFLFFFQKFCRTFKSNLKLKQLLLSYFEISNVITTDILFFIADKLNQRIVIKKTFLTCLCQLRSFITANFKHIHPILSIKRIYFLNILYVIIWWEHGVDIFLGWKLWKASRTGHYIDITLNLLHRIMLPLFLWLIIQLMVSLHYSGSFVCLFCQPKNIRIFVFLLNLSNVNIFLVTYII